MKKLKVFSCIVVISAALYSCQENKFEMENDAVIQNSKNSDVILENDYLSFSSYEALENTISDLRNCDNGKLVAFEESLNFESARTYRSKICNKLLNELSSSPSLMKEYVDELVKEGYYSWKDSSVIYPFFNISWDVVLNSNGLVKVNDYLFYFDSDEEIIALDGKNETLQQYLRGDITSENPLIEVYSYPKLKASGYYFDTVIKEVSKTQSNKRLTVKLRYDAVAYPNETTVEKIYYELYFHQERKVLFSWVDKQTHFYYYPDTLVLGGTCYDFAEWQDPEYVVEPDAWTSLNSSELANYYHTLWESGIENFATKGGLFDLYGGPYILMDYYFYSGQVGSETDSERMLITYND